MENENPSCIITGQQVGLLGGPLYTIYKILTAHQLSLKFGCKSFFWMELNDADFDEINHFYYINRDNSLVKKVWKANSEGKRTGDVIVTSDLLRTIDEFLNDISPSRLVRYWREILYSVYTPGKSWRECAKDFFPVLLKNFQIELFDPMDEKFIHFMQPILIKEFIRTEINQQCNGFVLLNGKREAVFRRKDGFYSRSGQKIDIEKNTLLPNFRTRPLVQDAYFPNAWQVVGPNEKEYLLELDKLYQFHEVIPSKKVDRYSGLIVPNEFLAQIENWKLDLKDFLTLEPSAIFQKYLKINIGFNVKSLEKRVNEHRQLFIDSIKETPLSIKDIDYQLKKILKNEMGKLRAKLKSQYKNELEMMEFISNFLFPKGKLQERIHNIVFMSLYLEKENLLDIIWNSIQKENKIVEI